MLRIGRGRKSISQKKRRIIAALIIVIPMIFTGLISFIVDWLWFDEIGYVAVFFTKLFTQIKIGLPVFVVVTLLICTM